ncbi:unnamed protein product [Penicillium bialowiezense]
MGPLDATIIQGFGLHQGLPGSTSQFPRMCREGLFLFTMRIAVLSALAIVAVADPSWWYFDAWDGLSCGDMPQDGKIFFSTEGTTDYLDDQACVNLDDDQRAYSYAATFTENDVHLKGFLHEDCKGPGKALRNNTCTNPSIKVPYIRSWRITKADDA